MTPNNEALAALKSLFKDAMDWGRSYGQRLNLSDITVDDVSEGYAEKALAALASGQAGSAVPTDEALLALVPWEIDTYDATEEAIDRRLTLKFARSVLALSTPAAPAQPREAQAQAGGVREADDAYGLLIKALAAMVNCPQTDEQFAADVLPRDPIMSQVHRAAEAARLMMTAARALCAISTPPAPRAPSIEEALGDFLEAQDALDNREYNGINAEDYFVLLRRRNNARDDLDKALAAPASAGVEEFPLPELPKGYVTMMTPDPEGTPAVIYFDDDMKDYGRECVRSYSASLGLQERGRANLGVIIDRDGDEGRFVCAVTEGHTPFIGDKVFALIPKGREL